MDGGWEEQRLQYRFENSMGWAGVLLRVGLIPLYIMAYAGTLIVFIENVILSENVAPCRLSTTFKTLGQLKIHSTDTILAMSDRLGDRLGDKTCSVPFEN